MRADSTAYVAVPITTTPPGVDLTLDTFDMAFAPSKNAVVPGSGALGWHPATYDAAEKAVKLLVGPGGAVIPPGKYVVLVRVHDTPEVPVIPGSGTFTIDALV